jgi:alkylhydroperoxidase family enzyme
VDIHSVRATEIENGPAKIAALANWEYSNLYTDTERIAIEYADRMTITGHSVDDAFFACLRLHFDEAQIVELTAGIAMENFRSKFNVPLQVAAQGFCVAPET